MLAEGQRGRRRQARTVRGSKPFDFVFHGGSGSLKSEIEDSLKYGVVKMNVDTDTQYAFTRPLAGHMFANYDGVLKIDGEVGNKKVYDPRSYLKKAEASMSERVVEACNDLHSSGRSASPRDLSVDRDRVRVTRATGALGRSSTARRGTRDRSSASSGWTGRRP